MVATWWVRLLYGDVPTITADDLEKNMRVTLEEVRKHIPKLFVNLVLPGNIPEVYKLLLKSPRCREVHRILPIECICAFASGKEGDKLRLEMDSLIADINTRQMRIAADYAQRNYPDFAVVVQPFFSKAKADNFPVEFLSNAYSESLGRDYSCGSEEGLFRFHRSLCLSN